MEFLDAPDLVDGEVAGRADTAVTYYSQVDEDVSGLQDFGEKRPVGLVARGGQVTGPIWAAQGEPG
jgi:hypothetical protein